MKGLEKLKQNGSEITKYNNEITNQIPTLDALFLQNPQKALQVIKQSTFEQAIQLHDIENKNGLAKIKKEKGAEYTKIVLESVLEYFSQILNGKNSTNNPFIIGELADEIMVNFYWLSISDIAHCLKKGVSGVYKNPAQFTKEEFEFAVVLSWVKKFDEERSNSFAQQQMKSQALHKVNDTLLDINYLAYIENLPHYKLESEKSQADWKRKRRIQVWAEKKLADAENKGAKK